MGVFEIIKARRSIRHYLDISVEKEKILQVLEAGRLSPSAANRQPWRFVFVNDKTVLKNLSAAYKDDWLGTAPVVIVACASPKEAWHRFDGEEYWKIDVAIALHSMILVAQELGLGTCWIGAFDENKLKQILKIPDDIRVVAMTPLGYPGEQKTEITDRKPLEQIIHYNQM